MSDTDIAIKVDGVSKAFKLPHEKRNSIKSLFVSMFRGRRTYERQQVLKDVSFEIKKGEFFGIVGRNGSGKSTLLKLLAGIYTPDKGQIQVNGKLTPFIELGVGFNPELTGRENVFLNGALLGFNRKEMEAMYNEIVAFAELEKFMDQKLKNYSSGMQVRLAFSIAIRANTDVLLLDEVLAVGDANFQRKCFNYFKELKLKRKTVVFVSHDTTALLEFCDKVALIDKGEVKYIGTTPEGVAIYNDLNFDSSTNTSANHARQRYGNNHVYIDGVSIRDKNGGELHLVKPNNDLAIKLVIRVKKTVTNPVVGVQISDVSGNIVVGTNNNLSDFKLGTLTSGKTYDLVFRARNILHNGSYTVSTAIKSADRQTLYDQLIDSHRFEVAGWAKISNGMTHPDFNITMEDGRGNG